MPIWITLKNVLEKFLSNSLKMVSSLEVVLGGHKRNAQSANQNFCIGVKIKAPFDLVLEAINLVNGKSILIQVDYNNLPTRCRYCLSTSHLIKECMSIPGACKAMELGKNKSRGVNPAKVDAAIDNNVELVNSEARKTISREQYCIGATEPKCHPIPCQMNG